MGDDSNLLSQYVTEKSESAFTALVERHLDVVYSAALRRVGGDAHTAADVAQEVFVRLARQASRLPRDVVLPAWLYITTRNVAVDVIRAEQRRRVREREAHMRSELEASGDRVEAWDRLKPLLDGAMDELAGRDREAVLLRFFARQSYHDIGRALAISEDAARMRVERALEKLRDRLAGRGVTSTAAALGLMITSEAAMAAPTGLAASVSGVALTAAATSSGAAAIFHLMSTTKFVATAAGLVVLLTVGLAVREFQQNRAAREAVEISATETIRLTTQGTLLARQIAAAEQTLVALEQASRATLAAAAEVVAPTDPAENGRKFLAEHPEATALVLEATRLGVRREHQLLFHSLQLSPAQVEQFVAIMTEASAGLQWGTAGQTPFATVDIGVKPTLEERNARLRAVIGDDNFQRYLDFRRAYGARNLAEEIVRDANVSAPVSPAQAAQLTDILAQQSSSYRAGKNFSFTDFNWDRATSELRAILGDKQGAVVAAIRERIEASNAVSRAERDERDAAKRAAGLPPNF